MLAWRNRVPCLGRACSPILDKSERTRSCRSCMRQDGGDVGDETLGNIGMTWLRSAVILAIALAAPIVAHAGGVDMTDEDLNGGADGPSFFGFVRIVDGPGIYDAKVTAELKGGALVTATDLLGLYKIPGFG